MALHFDTTQETGRQVEAAARELVAEIYGVALTQPGQCYCGSPRPRRRAGNRRKVVAL